MGNFLSPDVYIIEEAAQLPTLATLPSAVTGIVGVTERGPIAVKTVVNSWDEFVKIFGGFTADADAAIFAYGFFMNGGRTLWVVRTCHFTDLTNPLAYTALKGTKMVKTRASGSLPGSVTSTLAQPYNFEPGLTLDWSTELAGPESAVFNAAAADLSDGATYPVVIGAGQTLLLKIDNGELQTIVFAGTETTAADVAATINAQIRGASCLVSAAKAKIVSDKRGTASKIEVTGGTANAVLLYSTSPVSGTGNVADIDNVTGAEIKTVVEAATGNITVTVNGNGTLTFSTDTVGTGKWIRCEASSTADLIVGLDNLQHQGSAGAAENTLRLDGKTPGTYSDDISAFTTRASSDTSVGATDAEFNLIILQEGVVVEIFPNLTMDRTQSNHMEAVVNNISTGSNFVSATDLDLYPADPTLAKPDIGTAEPFRKDWGVMSGGNDGLTSLVDADFLGNSAGPTGLYCLDLVEDLAIVAIPDRASAAIHTGLLDYCEVWREGRPFAILDCPPVATVPSAAAMVDYVKVTAALLNRSEFGAIYWPRIKILNPASSVFGTDESIAVAYSGFIAGTYARNDEKTGGIYKSPAGIDGNSGVLSGCIGFESDEVLDKRKRDLLYPARINPITQITGTPRHIDGGRDLKVTGNWPHISQRRGVSYIEATIKRGLVWAKHLPNTPELRKRVERVVTMFLLGEMNVGAFASREPAKAFYVDVSDRLNPPSVVNSGKLVLRVGLAMNTPSEFIEVRITADTRALEEELASL